jgi:hypothetical protein
MRTHDLSVEAIKAFASDRVATGTGYDPLTTANNDKPTLFTIYIVLIDNRAGYRSLYYEQK